MFDADASDAPMPNPNVSLSPLLVRCVEARFLQSRFGTSEALWTFTVDFRIH